MAYGEKRGKYWRAHYKKPDGKWGSVSRDADGNRFTTERSAEKYGQTLEADVARKIFIDPANGKVTVKSWSETWLESLDVGPLTERDYRSRLNAAILPKWGTTAVSDITTVAYQTWVKAMKKEGRSPNGIRGITSVFRTMLDDAVLSRVIGVNPVPPRAAAKRGRYKGKKKQDEVVIATARQTLLVARNALDLRGLSYYVMTLTIAYAGLRMGEVAGLRREDVVLAPDDGRPPRILVQGQAQYIEGRREFVGAKYDSGRTLVIPPFLVGLLRALLASHKRDHVFLSPRGKQLLTGGDFYADSWQLFVNGCPARPSSRGHKARPATRPVAGIAGMRPHGLRHSMKVWLDEAGDIPRVAIEERMGHELPGSEGTYSHTTPAMEDRICEYLQGLWEESLAVVGDPSEWGPIPVEPIDLEVDLPKIAQGPDLAA